MVCISINFPETNSGKYGDFPGSLCYTTGILIESLNVPGLWTESYLDVTVLMGWNMKLLPNATWMDGNKIVPRKEMKRPTKPYPPRGPTYFIIFHLRKRNMVFKSVLGRDMLVPRRVSKNQWKMEIPTAERWAKNESFFLVHSAMMYVEPIITYTV